MGFFDFLTSQKIDVIRWDNPSPETFIKKWDHEYDELKNNSSLIVDPGLSAIFVHNGKIEAVQKESGKWSLETENVPFISSFKNIMSGLETHDKAAVYFLKTAEITNQKWGTPNDITYTDPVYNFPVDLRLFWNMSFKVKDVENFWVNYVANREEVTTNDVRTLITDRLIGRISSVLAELKISYNDIDAKAFKISEMLLSEVAGEFDKLGLELTDFRIEDTSFGPRTEEFITKIMDKRTDAMAVNEASNIGSEAMWKHIELEKVGAMRDAANNSGGASEGLGAGLGMAMGMNMANNMNAGTGLQNKIEESMEEKLEKAKKMFDNGLIDEAEYKEMKKNIISG